MKAAGRVRLAVEPDGVIVLHVGTHKTGTTLLQRYLTRHADQLRARGLRYLEREDMAQLVGWGDRLETDPQPLLDRIGELCAESGGGIVFASHEDLIGRPFPAGGSGQLYPCGPRNIAALGRAVTGAGYRLRTLLSVRPQHEFLESYYLQSVHEGGHLGFAEWLADVDLTALSYRPLVDAMREQCGPDGVEVVDFGLIRTGATAFLEHLLGRIDPRLASVQVEYRNSHNRSLSAKGLQMALTVNPLIKDAQRRRAVRFFLQRNYSNADYPRAVLLSDELTQALRERYGPEYDELVGRR